MTTLLHLRRRLTYSNVVATLAFFFALTGAASAGVKYLTASDPINSGDLSGTYGAPQLRPDSVTGSELASGAVTTSDIATGAVVSGSIASGAVTNSTIATGAVGTGSLAFGAVTTPIIATGAVGTGSIAFGAVTNSTIATGAVDSGSIAFGAVGTPEIATGAVTSAQIAAGAVTGADIDYARAQNSTASNGDDFKSVIVECPGGKVVSGGGFQINGLSTDRPKITIIASQPFAPPGSAATRWAVDAEEIPGQEATNWGVTAFAVCT